MPAGVTDFCSGTCSQKQVQKRNQKQVKGCKNTANKMRTKTAQKMLDEHTPKNQYCYNVGKLNIISTINQLHKSKILQI